MSLPPETVIDLIGTAIKKEQEDKLWEQWLHDTSNELSFNAYKQKAFKVKRKRTDGEVIEDAKNILKTIGKPK